ncbi:MAG: hypothetical protein JWN48_6146 [Myxococcaceae bacterium]|nr:hypothetical protein [Myxococcaceae bacterium]
MKQRACAVFREQRRAHALRFTCEHCTYFDGAREACSHGYPNAAHREAHFAGTAEGGDAGAPDVEVELIFCKDFELR